VSRKGWVITSILVLLIVYLMLTNGVFMHGDPIR